MDKADQELYERLKNSPLRAATERRLLEGAKAALLEAGTTPLKFLADNPGLSEVALAQLLNRGTTALGLVMAIYEEAQHTGVLRETAKDLLIRQIRYEYPDGWRYYENIRASVRLGSWSYELDTYVHTPHVGEYAERIIKALRDEPPCDGWTPSMPADATIDELFDRHWPLPNGESERPGQ